MNGRGGFFRENREKQTDCLRILTPAHFTILIMKSRSMKLSILLLSLFSFNLTALASESEILFNGKDLTGWTGEGYAVKDGVITCSKKGRNLRTNKEYTNYILEFEFKLPPGGNNGLGIHYTGHGNPANNGMEVQVLDNTAPKYKNLKPYQFHGGLYFLKAAKKGFLKPVGEWNREKITVNGVHVTVELNGKVINEANLDALAKSHPKHQGVKRRSGYITFCGHGDPVQFKNIRIKELPASKNGEATSQIPAELTPLKLGKKFKGYTPLFNGKDLTGWRQAPGHAGHWEARGNVLHYDGESTAKDKNLWTEKSFGDFILVCDWRWAEKAHGKRKRPDLDPSTGEIKKGPDGKPLMILVDELDSGIYLRGNSKSQVNIWNWPCGSGEVYGYRTQKKLPQSIRAAVTPKVNADNPIGQWNRFVIMMKGDQLTIELNGQTVIKNAKLPGVPQSGKLALQHHGSAIEFANIMIKEL